MESGHTLDFRDEGNWLGSLPLVSAVQIAEMTSVVQGPQLPFCGSKNKKLTCSSAVATDNTATIAQGRLGQPATQHVNWG